jgi:hypothetical protein
MVPRRASKIEERAASLSILIQFLRRGREDEAGGDGVYSCLTSFGVLVKAVYIFQMGACVVDSAGSADCEAPAHQGEDR